jgi:hypothetical protein
MALTLQFKKYRLDEWIKNNSNKIQLSSVCKKFTSLAKTGTGLRVKG